MRELSLNVMDVVQNSISAGADLIEITVEESPAEERLSIEISDNGRGMTPEQLRQVTDPFYTTRTTRNIGLGVPLFKMEAEMTGGGFEISSVFGEGTKLRASFCTGSIDMIPLGDLEGILHLLITCNPKLDFVYLRKRTGCQAGAGLETGADAVKAAGMESDAKKAAEMRVDTRVLKEILGEEVSLNLPEVMSWLREYLTEQLEMYNA